MHEYLLNRPPTGEILKAFKISPTYFKLRETEGKLIMSPICEFFRETWLCLSIFSTDGCTKPLMWLEEWYVGIRFSKDFWYFASSVDKSYIARITWPQIKLEAGTHAGIRQQHWSSLIYLAKKNRLMHLANEPIFYKQTKCEVRVCFFLF